MRQSGSQMVLTHFKPAYKVRLAIDVGTCSNDVKAGGSSLALMVGVGWG